MENIKSVTMFVWCLLSLISLSGCGGGASDSLGKNDSLSENELTVVTPPSAIGSPDFNSNYPTVTSASGFSSNYLNGKTFYQQTEYFGNQAILVREFSSTNVLLSDDYFGNSENVPYNIVSTNDVNGVIEYFDGTYQVYLSVHSVTADHLKICYTNEGLESVVKCDENQTIRLYFHQINILKPSDVGLDTEKH